jgi:hypothetical protein
MLSIDKCNDRSSLLQIPNEYYYHRLGDCLATYYTSTQSIISQKDPSTYAGIVPLTSYIVCSLQRETSTGTSTYSKMMYIENFTRRSRVEFTHLVSIKTSTTTARLYLQFRSFLSHTTIDCGELGIPSALPYTSHKSAD